jgi:transketolase
MIQFALEAAVRLAENGIEATVIDAYSLKPLDNETILSSAEKTNGLILTVEDNYLGLGTGVAHAAAAVGGIKVETMSVTKWPKSARKEPEIFVYCELSADDVSARASAMVK